MRKITRFALLIGTLSYAAYGFAQQPDAKYLHETPPDLTPKIFAPGKVSMPDVFEFGAVFSNSAKEFYYGVEINGKAETRMMKLSKGAWSKPLTILSHEAYSFNDPFLSPDDQKLFFISDRPLSGNGPKKDYDIWYVVRDGEKWSSPKNAGKNINSTKNEYYISFTKSNKMYFSSNVNDNQEKNDFDIYAAQMTNGTFLASTKLGPAINSSSYEADVFIAPDESYIVFAANRPEGLGSGDLYVSFRKTDGSWTQSKSLGNAINTETDDFCPYITADGKYLFYASRGDIYWVSTAVLNKLR